MPKPPSQSPQLESRRGAILKCHHEGISVTAITETLRSEGFDISRSTVWRRIKEWVAADEESGSVQAMVSQSCLGAPDTPAPLPISPTSERPAPVAPAAILPARPLAAAPIATHCSISGGPLLGLLAGSMIAACGFFLFSNDQEQIAIGVPTSLVPAERLALIQQETARLSAERTSFEAEKRAFDERRATLTVTLPPESTQAPTAGEMHNEMHSTQHETGNAPIDQMIAASVRNDTAEIFSLRAKIESLPRPPRGNRQVARTLNSEAIALLLHKQFDQAVALLHRAAVADPADVEVAENLGYAQLKAGNLTDARYSFYGALAMDPGRHSAWGNLGVVLAQTESEERAVAAFANSYLFAPDKQARINHFRKLATEETNLKVKRAAGRAFDGRA